MTTLMNRRELLQGAVASWGAIPLCCGTPELSGNAVSFEDRTCRIDLRLAGGLLKVGSAAAVVEKSRGLDIIVIRLGRHQFAALDRSCTHNGAPCAFDRKRRTLRCTSLNHAEFDLHGTLLHGRTHGNLRAYEVRLAGPILEIFL